MRRPICFASLIYTLGLVSALIFDFSILLLIFGFIGLTLIFFLFYIKKWVSFNIVLALIIFVTASINYQISHSYEGKLKLFFEKDIKIRGIVVDASYKNNLQLIIKTKEVIYENSKYIIEEKVLTSLKGEFYNHAELVGKVIEVEGALYSPEENRNPKLFNYKLYLKSKSIYSVLYGKSENIRVLKESFKGSPIFIANNLRSKIITNTLQVLPEKEGRVLIGILLGDKNELDQEIYEGFRNVGISHILAVSGLHVGIIYLFISNMVKKLSTLVRLTIIICIFSIYIIMTGYVPSILRATFMILLLILSPLFNRRYDLISSVAFTGLILLIVNPMFIVNIGFQLSFGAVLSIALLYKPILEKVSFLHPYLAQLTAASIAAQIGLIPLIAYHFNMISPWSFVVNIPIIFIIGYLLPFGIVTIILGGVIPFIGPLAGQILLIGIRLMINIAEIGSKLPLSGCKVVSPSMITVITYYGILYILLYKGQLLKKARLNKRKIILSMLTIYIATKLVLTMIPGKLEITFLDVGQGDCSIVKTPNNKVLLIDGGGNTYSSIDIGERTLVPYLLKNGIKKIDLLVVSHFHYDHVGGLYKVLEDLKIDGIIVGEQPEITEEFEKFMALAEEKTINTYRVVMGTTIAFEKDIELQILNPPNLPFKGSRDDINNNSIVLLLNYKDRNVLFTGDIEKEAEKYIIDSNPDMEVDIIKVPHHGSRFSSTDEFISQLQPKIAVIQVGRNLFGHPHEEVLEKLEEKDSIIFRNDKNGAIIISVDNERILVNTTLD